MPNMLEEPLWNKWTTKAELTHAQHVKSDARRHVNDECLVYTCATYQKSSYAIWERRGPSLYMRRRKKEPLCDMWTTNDQSAYMLRARRVVMRYVTDAGPVYAYVTRQKSHYAKWERQRPNLRTCNTSIEPLCDICARDDLFTREQHAKRANMRYLNDEGPVFSYATRQKNRYAISEQWTPSVTHAQNSRRARDAICEQWMLSLRIRTR